MKKSSFYTLLFSFLVTGCVGPSTKDLAGFAILSSPTVLIFLVIIFLAVNDWGPDPNLIRFNKIFWIQIFAFTIISLISNYLLYLFCQNNDNCAFKYLYKSSINPFFLDFLAIQIGALATLPYLCLTTLFFLISLGKEKLAYLTTIILGLYFFGIALFALPVFADTPIIFFNWITAPLILWPISIFLFVYLLIKFRKKHKLKDT